MRYDARGLLGVLAAPNAPFDPKVTWDSQIVSLEPESAVIMLVLPPA